MDDVVSRFGATIPDELKRQLQEHDLEGLESLLREVDVRGKAILEIGPVGTSISAGLLKALGAAQVMTVPITQWYLRPPVFAEGSFDVIHGWGVLAGVGDVDEFLREVQRLLKADGVACLQGMPLLPESAARFSARITEILGSRCEQATVAAPLKRRYEAGRRAYVARDVPTVALTVFVRKRRAGIAARVRHGGSRILIHSPGRPVARVITRAWQPVRYVLRQPKKCAIQIHEASWSALKRVFRLGQIPSR